MVILTTQGKDLILQKIINKVEQQDLVLRLFTNNYDPEKSSSRWDFDEPIMNYSFRTMWGLFWELEEGKIKAVEEIFTFEGPAGKIRGWFITEGDIVVWAEKFDKPFDVKRKGDKIKLNFRLGIK